ncbi:MAG: hypothetical protein K2H39_08315, partial [Paramuribaculum sp.]|nr:hypothetical protein [Paramuribaculum sp.]
MKSDRLIIYFFLLCALAACSTSHDPRVEGAFALAETYPEAALDSIAAIDTLSLSTTDRMMISLAKIKASDKASKPIPYESEILRLTEYYATHETDRLYPTALYYAGRIYSEAGDSPTALRYFQNALDLLSNDCDAINLKSCVLSQMAGTLARLHLTDEAIPFYDQVLNLDSIINDTTNLIYDLADYAENLRWGGRYNEATKYLNKSMCLAKEQRSDFLPVLKLFLARIKIKTGHTDDALELLREAKDSIEDSYLIDFMTTAANVYYHNHDFDSVFSISKRIVELNSTDNAKRIGYFFLSQEELEKYSSKDSLK